MQLWRGRFHPLAWEIVNELNGDRSAWLRCYRCWSQRLEAQVHYDAILRIDPETGESADRVDEVQEAVVQCLDCMHDQPHLTIEEARVVPIEDRWERMVAGKPFVASCTVMVDQDLVDPVRRLPCLLVDPQDRVVVDLRFETLRPTAVATEPCGAISVQLVHRTSG